MRFLFRCFPFLIFLSLFISLNLSAQESDTLNAVEIIHKKKNAEAQKDFTAGQTNQKMEERFRQFYLNSSLSQLISQQTSVFVKSYGVNSMATLSIRGASASQSSILWNGVPVMNPAIGVADVSLLQAGLFDNIELQYGSAAALWGSGNVGGALMLGDNLPQFYRKKMLSASFNFGSFNRYDGLIKTAFSNRKWHVLVVGFYQSAKNNFSYKDETDSMHTMPNARLQAGGAMANVSYNLDHKRQNALLHFLSLDIWYQKYYRQIPPALFESLSHKEQTDQSIRSLLQWRFDKRNYSFYIKESMDNESILYSDTPVIKNNNSKVWQYYQETGFRRNWISNKHPLEQELLIFSPLQYSFIQSLDTSRHNQFRPAIAAAYKFSLKNYTANVMIRQEWWNGKAAPLLPGIGMEYNLVQSDLWKDSLVLKLTGALQRTYRIPTLNELFIFPGGNTALKPEQGWSREVGYTFQYIKKNDDKSIPVLKHQLVYFNRDIKDWIIWLGGAVWTPHNIAEVYSRGIETHNSGEFHLKKFTLFASLNTTYVLSTGKKSYLPADSSYGRQIPYTPRYVYQANIGMEWKGLTANCNYNYNGYRFVTMDESQYLAPYQTTNIQLSYSFRIGNGNAKTLLQIQNLWNEHYEIVAQRPMPGRYFIFGIQISI